MFKKISVAAFALGVSTAANAGLISDMMTSDFEVRNPDARYKVEVYGFDLRVYEFTPVTQPNHTCVFIASGGSTNSIQMECFEKIR
jgi:hypothetical protein